MDRPGSDPVLEAGADVPLREEEEALGDKAPPEERAGCGGTDQGRKRWISWVRQPKGHAAAAPLLMF